MLPRAFAAMIVAGAFLTGCDLPPPPDTATVPANAFGAQGSDVGALFIAQSDFASASRTSGNPAEAAKALAALDYIAGQLSTGARWVGVSPITKDRMLQARMAMRAAMGIAPGAPSQVVVTGLLMASADFAAGEPGKAASVLAPPAFPPDMSQRLSSMPYMQIANIATTLAGGEAISGPYFGGNGED